jgi:hypothetical protein
MFWLGCGNYGPTLMAELLLLSSVLALFGLAFWLTTDSDDDGGGGGMMQPVLVPIRASRSNQP